MSLPRYERVAAAHLPATTSSLPGASTASPDPTACERSQRRGRLDRGLYQLGWLVTVAFDLRTRRRSTRASQWPTVVQAVLADGHRNSLLFPRNFGSRLSSTSVTWCSKRT